MMRSISISLTAAKPSPRFGDRLSLHQNKARYLTLCESIEQHKAMETTDGYRPDWIDFRPKDYPWWKEFGVDLPSAFFHLSGPAINRVSPCPFSKTKQKAPYEVAVVYEDGKSLYAKLDHWLGKRLLPSDRFRFPWPLKGELRTQASFLESGSFLRTILIES